MIVTVIVGLHCLLAGIVIGVIAYERLVHRPRVDALNDRIASMRQRIDEQRKFEQHLRRRLAS